MNIGELKEGDAVWVTDEEESWIRGTLYSIRKEFVEVDTEEFGVKKIPRKSKAMRICSRIASVTSSDYDSFDQLANMREVSDPSVFTAVKQRYLSKNIHSMIGNILIVVNPYEMLDIYRDQFLEEAKSQRLNMAHVYGIASAAIAQLKERGRNQTVTISGESGAGKTETAKKILYYIMRTSPRNSVSKAILDSNCILEAFGNAKTVRNNNSSRFGKFIKILFDKEYKISGASLNTYMLEKSRVVKLAPNERNYHIFYQLLYGVDGETKEHLMLDEPNQYNYLSGSSCYDIHGVKDADDFVDVIDALRTYDVDDEHLQGLLEILSAILHLGNITFTTNDDDDTEFNNCDNTLNNVADLLGVDLISLQTSLLGRRMKIGDETIMVRLSPDQAAACRDSLSKHLYGNLFDWLVQTIAFKLGNTVNIIDENNTTTNNNSNNISEKFIGVLDIFGFEIFDDNSLEQFNINYANEKLQAFFNEDTFQHEIDMYVEEGIPVDDFTYENNSECLKLIEGQVGLIGLLNDECNLGDAGTGISYLNKIEQNLNNNIHYYKDKTTSNYFGIKHFASDVTYCIDKFVEKNREVIREEHTSMLKDSISPLVVEIVNNAILQQEKNSSNKKGGRKSKVSSLCSTFKKQLHDLVMTLEATDAHFIKCVKPNDSKKPGIFDSSKSYKQLCNLGVMDVVKILTMGYNSRIDTKEFVMRYSMMLRQTPCEIMRIKNISNANIENYKLGCESIVEWIIDNNIFLSKDAMVGNTKVFIKDIQRQNNLDKERYKNVMTNIIIIQSTIRMFLGKRRAYIAKMAIIEYYQKLEDVIVKVQAQVRGALVRWSMWDLRYVIKLRGALSRRDVMQSKMDIDAISMELEQWDNDGKTQDYWQSIRKYFEFVMRRGEIMITLIKKQNNFIKALQIAIRKENAVGINSLLPLARQLCLLGHPVVVLGKKKLLQLYYVRTLGVSVVEFLEDGEAHRGDITLIVDAFSKESFFSNDFCKSTLDIKTYFDKIHVVRDSLRDAIERIDEGKVRQHLEGARKMRSKYAGVAEMEYYAETEVRSGIAMLRLLEMERQLNGTTGQIAKGPLMDEIIYHCCDDILHDMIIGVPLSKDHDTKRMNVSKKNKNNTDKDNTVISSSNSNDKEKLDIKNMSHIHIELLKKACKKSPINLDINQAIQYFKWVKTLSSNWKNNNYNVAIGVLDFFGLDMGSLNSGRTELLKKLHGAVEEMEDIPPSFQSAIATETKRQIKIKEKDEKHPARWRTSNMSVITRGPITNRHEVITKSTASKQPKNTVVSNITLKRIARRKAVETNDASFLKSESGKQHLQNWILDSSIPSMTMKNNMEKLEASKPSLSKVGTKNNTKWENKLRTKYVNQKAPTFYMPTNVVRNKALNDELEKSRKAVNHAKN
jgi:hypothetical protein